MLNKFCEKKFKGNSRLLSPVFTFSNLTLSSCLLPMDFIHKTFIKRLGCLIQRKIVPKTFQI